MLIVIRIGSALPILRMKYKKFFELVCESDCGSNGAFSNAITGGSFNNMAIFALNITPYITSSVVMQLLTIAIPKLEEMRA